MRLNRSAPLLALGCIGLLASCSSARKKPGDGITPSPIVNHPAQQSAAQSESPDLHDEVAALSAKVADLQQQLTRANQQLEATKTVAENAMGVRAAQESVVASTHEPGVSPEPTQAAKDPEAGFVSNAAIQSYRQAMILFESKKYPEAVLAFAAFLDRYADHPLAGTAQCYIGESYFRENQSRLARKEFAKVLSRYDRSAAVPAALERLTEIAGTLKLPKEQAQYRQLLTLLYPGAPATALLSNTTMPNTTMPNTTMPNTTMPAEPSGQAALEQPAPEPSPVQDVHVQAPSDGLDAPPATAPLPSESAHPTSGDETTP